MKKYLLAGAASAAVAFAAGGAFAQQLSKLPEASSGMAQFYQGKSAPPLTTQAPETIPLVNTGDFWFGVYGRADMYLEVDGTSAASTAAIVGGPAAKPSKSVITAYPTNSAGYQAARLGFNSDQIFAPGWDAYEELEMRLNYNNGTVTGLTGSSTGLGTSDGTCSVNGVANANCGGGLWSGGFTFIAITGQDFGTVEMGKDGTFMGQPSITEDSFGTDPATTNISMGVSREANQINYKTLPAMLGGHVVVGGGLMGNWGGNTNLQSTSIGYTAPDANSSFFDATAPEWGVDFVAPDSSLNVYYGGMVYMNRQPSGGALEASGFNVGINGASVVGGNAVASSYTSTDVKAGGNEWLNEIAAKYNAGFWQAELLVGNETGLTLAHPVSTGATSDVWLVGGGVSFLLNAPSYKPGNSVTRSGTQLVGVQVWEETERTKVNLLSGATTVKTSVNPTAYKAGVHWEYHFTPNFFYTAALGYIWNQNGAGATVGGTTNGVMQNDNSWALNTGFDFYF